MENFIQFLPIKKLIYLLLKMQNKNKSPKTILNQIIYLFIYYRLFSTKLLFLLIWIFKLNSMDL